MFLKPCKQWDIYRINWWTPDFFHQQYGTWLKLRPLITCNMYIYIYISFDTILWLQKEEFWSGNFRPMICFKGSWKGFEGTCAKHRAMFSSLKKHQSGSLLPFSKIGIRDRRRMVRSPANVVKPPGTYGGFQNRGTSKWMVYMENLIKMDDLGVTEFKETCIFSAGLFVCVYIYAV